MTIPHSEPAISVEAPLPSDAEDVLTPEALRFLTGLQHRFDARRRELLEKRAVRQKAIDAGKLPEFLPETESIRKANWKAKPIPKDLMDRRAEITGPVDRK
jgi:malate synthase